VETREGHHVDGEFPEISVQLTREPANLRFQLGDISKYIIYLNQREILKFNLSYTDQTENFLEIRIIESNNVVCGLITRGIYIKSIDYFWDW
jgi:hypothetical protein